MSEPEKTLHYSATGAARESSQVAFFKTFSIPAVLAVGGAFVHPLGLYVGGGAGLAYAVWAWMRRGKIGGALLEVEGRSVTVTIGSDRTRVEFEDLLNVTLDSKSIQPVQEGSAMVPQTRFLEATSGPEIEESRIVLVIDKKPDLPLSETRGSYSDAIEWMGKIRSFLRKNGWTPEDER